MRKTMYRDEAIMLVKFDPDTQSNLINFNQYRILSQ